ncbi:MAG: response regulator [Stenomitos rutilans HA7619-LM2]|jgi:two-component system sensor histidine kinase/response regulator|nr:response regulator [Stenomitos rutilans HA7619-LM2]
MSSDRRLSLSWVLPCGAFEQISSALQQTAQTGDQTSLVLTEATLRRDRTMAGQGDRFVVVVSHQFSGLLMADPTPNEALHETIHLTFAPESIAAFLSQLHHQSQHRSKLVDRLHQAVQQVQANNPDLQSEFTLRLADLMLTHSPASPTNAVTAALEQQHLLEQRVIERTQELHDALLAAQAANRTKTEFLAAMSHELRTPLTCVIGMAETLLRVMAMKPDTYPLQPQKQQEYLKLIKRSGEHLLELITDILEVSQVEAGKVVLDVKPFSLSQVAHQSLQILQERAHSKGVELALKALEHDSQSLNSTDVEDDAFMADPHRVSQILLNLLSNAIKFTPAGGRVTLRFGSKHNTAIFQVEDTGIGIADNQRSLLFQKFQQLDSSLTRNYEGTGLGLALTKQLVELHNGKIEVNSTVGVGSIFTVWLPAQSVNPSIAHLTDKTASLMPAIAPNLLETEAMKRALPIGERVVLIEDHDETALLICDLLTAADCQVVWMIDGATAMRQIELLRPRLIIANIQLPDLHGDQIIQFLRDHPALQATKVLALMAKVSSKDHTVQGVDDYLIKPVEPYQLLDKVATLVGRE